VEGRGVRGGGGDVGGRGGMEQANEDAKGNEKDEDGAEEGGGEK